MCDRGTGLLLLVTDGACEKLDCSESIFAIDLAVDRSRLQLQRGRRGQRNRLRRCDEMNEIDTTALAPSSRRGWSRAAAMPILVKIAGAIASTLTQLGVLIHSHFSCRM